MKSQKKDKKKLLTKQELLKEYKNWRETGRKRQQKLPMKLAEKLISQQKLPMKL